MMTAQLSVQKSLRRKFQELQSRNARYSVRAFALRLGMSASAVNEILKGERRISRKLAGRISDRLQLSPTERAELLKDFPARQKRSRSQALADENSAMRLSADQFAAISHWSHFAILSLVRLPGFQESPEWIATRLGVTERQARDALERLLRMKLLERGADGTLRRSSARLNTTDDITDMAIQKSHLIDLELARQSLLRDPVELRDFSSLTLPVAPRLLSRAKELIRRAQDELAELLESEPGSEVYRLSVYLFPLTLTRNERKKEN